MKNKIFIFLILVLCLLPVLSLFHPGLPLTHDGKDHVARIANFYQNLNDGNLIPRWGANLNWGYGHPILEFLYPFPSYAASAIHFIGFSLVDSVKMVFGLGMILSLLFMYLWLSQFLSRYAALLGAILYTYAPYRFVETYVRGDIGENLAFAFVPLVLYFLYRTYKTPKPIFTILGSFSLALLILSHNAISLMLMPFIILYGFFLFYLSKNRKDFLLSFIPLLVLGFTLSSFFWIPALVEGKYTLRNIVTKGGYLTNFVDFKNLIYGSWNYGGSGQFTQQIGIFQWVALILSQILIYMQKKSKDKNFLLSLLLLVFSVFVVFLMLPVSNFVWSKVMLLQNFQFPWRFLAITVFSTAVLGALVVDKLFSKIRLFTVTLSILVVIFISSFYWQPKAYMYEPESFYTGIWHSTTDTGESAPIWSVRFMEKVPPAPAQVVEGKGTIEEIEHKTTYRKFSFKSDDSAKILINTLYFPNWTVYVDGKAKQTQFQDPNYRGLMTFVVGGGEHTIETVFKDTKLRMVSTYISVLSLVVILLFLGFRFVKGKNSLYH